MEVKTSMERKKGFIATAYVLVALFAVGFVLAYAPKEQAVKAATIPNSSFTVVVDPGHGYNKGSVDNGASAPDGTRESALNVQLGGKVAAALKARGYTVYSTLDVGNGIPNLIDNLKPNITLEGRASAANQIGADLYISVHHNSFGGGGYNSASGTVVLHDPEQYKVSMRTKSQALASMVYSAVSALPGAAGNRGNHVIAQGATVLRSNNAPAVTLEAGFVTNAADLARVKDQGQQAQMAAKVADAIEGYFQKYGKEDNAAPTLQSVDTGGSPSDSPKFTVTAVGVEDASGVASVKYDVYTKGRKGAGVKTVNAANKGDGKWSAAVNIKTLFGDIQGVYAVEVKAADNAGNSAVIGMVNVEYTKGEPYSTCSVVRTSATPSKKAKFSVAAYGVAHDDKIAGVSFDVYPHGKELLAKSVGATDKGGGKWLASVDVAQLFAGAGGVYDIEAYATNGKGSTSKLGTASVEYIAPVQGFSFDSVKTSANPSAKPVFSVAVYGLYNTQGVKKVEYKVYPTRKKSQARTVSAKSKSGKWQANVNVKTLFPKQGEGLYIVDIYATDKKGAKVMIKQLKLAYGTTAALQSKAASAAPVAVGKTRAMAGVSALHTRFLNNDTALHTMAAEPAVPDTMPPTLTRVNTSKTPSVKPKFTVAAYGVNDESGVKGVEFQVYPKGRKNKAKPVAAKLKGEKWTATVDLTKLFAAKPGIYNVDVYATDTKGNGDKIGMTSVEFIIDKKQPTLERIERGASPTDKKSFYVSAYGVSDPSGVQSVEFQVYLAARPKKETLKKYKATNMGKGRWRAKVVVKDFKGAVGEYKIVAYGTDKKGNPGKMGVASIEIGFIDPNQYKIMGASNATSQQLYNYYVNRVGASAYPYQQYMSLKKFCELYISECKIYNIKPEVAFAQMVHETNFLKFTGDVRAEQFNFAGIGATGGGVPGNSFPTIQVGVKAQLQHLYAYACKDPLPAGEGLVDPRFTLVTRGIAPTVELLSQKWATGSDYGVQVVGHISGIMRSGASTYQGISTGLVSTFLTAQAQPEQTRAEEEPDEVFDEPEMGIDEPGMDVEEPGMDVEEPGESMQMLAAGEEALDEETEQQQPADSGGYGILGEAGATREQIAALYAQGALLERPAAEEPVNEDPAAEEKAAGGETAGKDPAADLLLVYGLTPGQLADLFFEEAEKQGVRPEVAFLQAMRETEFLTFLSRPAGWDKDNVGGFAGSEPADLREGVRIQVDYLKRLGEGSPLPALAADQEWAERLEALIGVADGMAEKDTAELVSGIYAA